jgi:hypothetical protein
LFGVWRRQILDEAHRVKNDKALQSKALRTIQRYNSFLLTGVILPSCSCSRLPPVNLSLLLRLLAPILQELLHFRCGVPSKSPLHHR